MRADVEPATAPLPRDAAPIPHACAALPTATAPESFEPDPVPEPADEFHPIATPFEVTFAPLPRPMEYPSSRHFLNTGSLSSSMPPPAAMRSSTALLRRSSASVMFLKDAKYELQHGRAPSSGGVPSSPSSGVTAFASASSAATIPSNASKYELGLCASPTASVSSPLKAMMCFLSYSRIFVPPQSS